MQDRNDPGCHRAVSLHLSRVLDEVGLNTFIVKKRRDMVLWQEHMTTLRDRLKGMNTNAYHFGSQTEGATTPGMNSDIDQLSCVNNFNVIEDWVDWNQGKTNLLMLHENTAPGYCRLQLLRADVPMAREDLPGEHFTYDSSGRVIIKNTWIHSVVGKRWKDRSGPAATLSGEPGFMAHDYVYAFKCNIWPAQAAEFTRPRRRHGWPSQRLLEEAVSHGVFLVPVGYKPSPTESLEWRLSASLAERFLMFSLTIVHIKCYVVLKILIKTFIEPRLQKCISSYHCKTALLHCTETTEPDFWHEDNLLQCINRCLDILRKWVADIFCPHFIIREENLFAGKVTVRNRELLLFIITWLINGDGRALLHVQMDGIGHKLQSKLNTEPSCVPIVDSLVSVRLFGQLERNMQDIVDSENGFLIVDTKNEKHMALIQSLRLKIIILKEILVDGRAVKYERRAIQTVIPLLSCWLGSLLASFALSHNRRVPRQAIQLMSTAAEYDVASILKLASVFYCSGKFGKVEYILQKLENHFRRNYMVVICTCYDKPRVLPKKVFHMMYALRGKKTRAKLFAHCVRFSRREIHCAPAALRHEMYREIGDDLQHRDPDYDKWMTLAAVDCLPFLYFLQYLTYKQLEKHDLQRHSLHNLDRCVREYHDFRHLETAWNLLGQCHEDEQDPNAAMTCYRTSLEIRPRNNAANWHVQNLRYMCIRKNGHLPT